MSSATVDYSTIKYSTTALESISEKACKTKVLTAEAIQKVAENRGEEVAACFMTYQRTQERAYAKINTIINKAAGLKSNAYLLANEMRCLYVLTKSTSFFARLKMNLLALYIEFLKIRVENLRTQGYECGRVIETIHDNIINQIKSAAGLPWFPESSN